ncbi:hypothetical protein GQ44DRAFT_687152 [Phaeosphaeriaceae sp. PMI808]|nr:hypothetical protein GQ44DRAFT_687152 [Phaeosphaeriaceae sp. PMI808]
MVTRNYADGFNALLSFYSEISENVPQFNQYQILFHDNTHMQLALAHIYRDILEFHKEALRYFRQRTWKELFHATWRSFSNTVTHLSQNLHRHKSLIESQASIAEYEKLQDLYIQSMRHFEVDKQAELDRKRKNVQHWLGTVDAQSRHEDATKARYATSGNWLIQEPQFKQWFDFNTCQQPLLWLSGIPGAASRIIDSCKGLPHARVGFFYCRHTDEDRNAFASVARTIISQLMVNDDLLLELIYERAARCGETILSTSITSKSLLKIVLQTYSAAQKTYIIIDGLDEYNREDRKEIIFWFKEQNTHTDIETYCQMWHQRINQRFGPLDPNEQNISKVVTARAQGMFLYAKLVMWNLHEQPNRKSFKNELRPETLPDGLEQAVYSYGRVIDRIIGPDVQPKSRSENAKKLLGWLVCAKRALYWREIQGAVSIDLEEGTICPDLRFEDDCKDLCASLVDRASDGTVVLVHSTAKRFLIDGAHIYVPEVEFDLALRCLTYMSFEQFKYPTDAVVVHAALHKGEFSFADYASCFWAHHLVESLQAIKEPPSSNLEDLKEAIDALLDMQGAQSTKLLVVSPTMTKALSALVCFENYDRICQAIISTKNQLLPTGKGPSEDEPLQIAKALGEIRTALEALAISPATTKEEKVRMEEFYGSKLFKCHRINCQFYWKGFETRSSRDNHISKHERAFTCTEADCFRNTIGCVTAQDLRKHLEDDHGIFLDADPEFPEDKAEAVNAVKRKPKNPATFECHVCLKKFTRVFNLRTHLRTHGDERPFACSKCSKTFTRQYDHKRHERQHWKFICRGNRKDGKNWGCGSRFENIESVGEHFEAEDGRVCIQPLIEELNQDREESDWL